MRIKLTKGMREDYTAIERNDSSSAEFTFPKKGPLPHDAVHFFVERELGMEQGFWGRIAKGALPEDITSQAILGGHASASRAQKPSGEIVELLQVERLVECFEAQSWSGSEDDAGLLEMARSGWSASFVEEPHGVEDAVPIIRTELQAFSQRWNALNIGDSLVLNWEEPL